MRKAHSGVLAVEVVSKVHCCALLFITTISKKYCSRDRLRWFDLASRRATPPATPDHVIPSNSIKLIRLPSPWYGNATRVLSPLDFVPTMIFSRVELYLRPAVTNVLGA